MAEKTSQELERIYTIPLREVKTSPRNHQADRAIRHIKRYLSKHMKAEDIWIDASVNEKIWARGMYTTPSKIRVRARKFDDGVVEVSLPDVEVKASIREEIQNRKDAAKKDTDEKKKSEKKDEKKDDEPKEEKKPASEDKPEKASEKKAAPETTEAKTAEAAPGKPTSKPASKPAAKP